ncbi:MAG: phosphatidylinositol mannoside acyltransferase [Ilumatobacteraceae bacterium]|jgi:phosphatidylinositol dimannoside acyltransferase|nr:phosphatidylinositol mannoside acyltransferase [Ilumatobacteraceae bacterium]MDP4713338.1 phosphatidylinositol mannoside acyltransferase [Ilumatobacteraceae bacterium]MDP4937380.1 phosphatidylinositol mannoside acyltransferase [Ilumatobacteraceae bacterium]MDP5115581.1 phosphatidylinositol mannoside acyltransferase [Ilumatobacteraceae bacterium]
MASSARQEIGDTLVVGSYKLGSLLSKGVPGFLSGTMGSLVGLPASLGMRDKRKMVERHMRRVRPNASSIEIRRLTQQVFDSYARYYLESFRLPTLTSAQVAASFTVEGYHENMLPALDRGKGVILALPHLGGWEWAGRWAADLGNKMTVVVEPIQPPELFEWFADLRRKFGMTVIPLGPDAGPAVLKSLRNNEVLCLLSDRDITGGGIEVEFFGERTKLPAGPATLALRTGAALLPTAAYFTDRGVGHHGVIGAPMNCERHGKLREDVHRITQELAYELETLIRRAPEQWHLLQPNWPSDPGYGEDHEGSHDQSSSQDPT